MRHERAFVKRQNERCDSERVTEEVCATCGRPVEVHDRHVRFGLPDPVLDTPDQDKVNGAWLSHGDANSSVMMQIPGVGPFVRALLPVHLTGGYTITCGVWVAIHPDELQRPSAGSREPPSPDSPCAAPLASGAGIGGQDRLS